MMRISPLLLTFFAVVAGLSGQIKETGSEVHPPSFGNITVAELSKRMESNKSTILLDVRTPPEFAGPLGHIGGAILIPVQELQARVGELDKHKDSEIIVICRSGNRSRTASEILLRHGFKATNVLGGMRAWKAMTAASQKKDR